MTDPQLSNVMAQYFGGVPPTTICKPSQELAGAAPAHFSQGDVEQLALHEQKTRLIEFGKLSSELRRKRGAHRCETFGFLGFTHCCASSWDGRFVVKRRTDRQRLTRKLKELRSEARRRMHTPIVLQYRWLCSVLRGHFAYFGLPNIWNRLNAFSQERVTGRWPGTSHEKHAGV